VRVIKTQAAWRMRSVIFVSRMPFFPSKKSQCERRKNHRKKNYAEAHDIELFIAFKKILLYTFFDFVRFFFTTRRFMVSAAKPKTAQDWRGCPEYKAPR
jgi:hypothetical protein